MRKLTTVLWVACFCQLCPSVNADEFLGWQEIRVIEQDGRPDLMRAGDVDGDGRDEVIVVNPRFSRLEVYRWVDRKTRIAAGEADSSSRRANELPMARELQRDEVQLEQLPRDVVVTDVDGDKSPELVVLVSPPSRIVVLSQNDDEKAAWQEMFRGDLLAGDISARDKPMLLRRRDDGSQELLVSFSDGIQSFELKKGGRAEWLTPREKLDRTSWWLADLDQDGDHDLVEQTRKGSASIRWYPCADDGTFLPAQTLFERSVSGSEVLSDKVGSELVVIDNSASGIVRRYRMAMAEKSALGLQRTMALVGESEAAWCGMQQGDRRALVVADPQRPRLLCYGLDDEGWQAEQSYPSVGEVVGIVAPTAAPKKLLIRTKEATDLFVSEWNEQRLTYPKIWSHSTNVADRAVVALSQVGNTTWWVQRVGSDVDLYRWSPGEDEESEPEVTRFPRAGKSVTEALWIGGERLLVKNRHSRGLTLIELQDEKTKSTDVAHLKKADLDEFKLFEVDGDLQLGRFVNGVLQWLDNDLQSYEQIMLPDGQEIAAFVPLHGDAGWGLENESPYVHRLAGDESGVIRSSERIKVARGQTLVSDPHLGLLLVNRDRVTHLSEGEPFELELLGTLDKRIGREGGIRETRMHRIEGLDLDGDETEELLLFDDLEHRITALKRNEEGQLSNLIGWQVFDDKVYPYGDEQSNRVDEPRALCSLDLDGDGHRDLALLCHDRLIIYLGRGD